MRSRSALALLAFAFAWSSAQAADVPCGAVEAIPLLVKRYAEQLREKDRDSAISTLFGIQGQLMGAEANHCLGEARTAYALASLELLLRETLPKLTGRSDSGVVQRAMYLVRQIADRGKITFLESGDAAEAIGMYRCTTSEIALDPRLPPYDLGATFAHELDHLVRDKLLKPKQVADRVRKMWETVDGSMKRYPFYEKDVKPRMPDYRALPPVDASYYVFVDEIMATTHGALFQAVLDVDGLGLDVSRYDPEATLPAVLQFIDSKEYLQGLEIDATKRQDIPAQFFEQSMGSLFGGLKPERSRLERFDATMTFAWADSGAAEPDWWQSNRLLKNFSAPGSEAYTRPLMSRIARNAFGRHGNKLLAEVPLQLRRPDAIVGDLNPLTDWLASSSAAAEARMKDLLPSLGSASELCKQSVEAAMAGMLSEYAGLRFDELRFSGGGNRPSGGGNRPSGGGNRPSGGGNRPSGGGNRPSGGGNRPSSLGTRACLLEHAP